MKLTPLLVSTFISTVPFYPLYAMEDLESNSSHSLPAKMNSDDDAFSKYSYLLGAIEEKEGLARKAAITTKLLPLFGDQQSSWQCARVVGSALQLSVEESTARGDAIAKSVLTLFGDQRSSWDCLSVVSDAFDFSAEEINARGKAITTSVLHLFEKIDSKTRAAIVSLAFKLSAEEITPRAQAIEKVILPLFGDQLSSWPCSYTLKRAFELSVEEITARGQTIVENVLPLFGDQQSSTECLKSLMEAFELSVEESTARGKAIQSILPLLEKFNSEERAAIVSLAFTLSAEEINARSKAITTSILPLFEKFNSEERAKIVSLAFKVHAEEITARGQTIAENVLPLFGDKQSSIEYLWSLQKAFALSVEEITARGKAIKSILPSFEKIDSKAHAEIVSLAFELSVEEITARGQTIAENVLPLFGDQLSSWTCSYTLKRAFELSVEEITARGKAIQGILPLFEKFNSEERAEIVNLAFTLSAKEITPRAQAIEKSVLPLFGDQHASWRCLFTVRKAFELSVEEITARSKAITTSILPLFGDQQSSGECLQSLMKAFELSVEEITARGKAVQGILPLCEKFNSEECAEIVNAAFQIPAKEITQRAQTIVKSVLPLFDAQHSSWQCSFTIRKAFELSAEEITARGEAITQIILPLFTNKISPALRAQIVMRAFQLSAAEIKSGGVSLFNERVEENKEDTTPLTSSTLTEPSQPEPSSPFLQDWLDYGLLKTTPLEVKEGQKLTVTCDFEEVTTPTEISFLNSAQNGYYSGGVTIQPGQTSVTFTSAVPQGDTQTWLVVRNPAFNGQDKLPLGVRISTLNGKIEDAPERQVFTPSNLLQDWVNLGLMKTASLPVKEGNKLTVTCDFEEVTEPTAISFINSAQNGYYEGGVTVQPGQKSAAFTSVVPQGDTQTWILLRNPAFNGTTPLTLGIKLKEMSLSVEK